MLNRREHVMAVDPSLRSEFRDIAAITRGDQRAPSPRLGARVILSEAGPRLFGSPATASLVDELLATVAPQLAGRGSGTGRLGMVEGAARWPADPRGARLRSVRRAGDHRFQRYEFEETR
jgi:riboflavin biosynthesis pyrimidine reductase